MTLEQVLQAGYSHGMYQHRGEIEALCRLLVEHKVQRAIEIGSHRGGTAVCFGLLASSLMVAVDAPDGPWGGIGQRMATHRDAELRRILPHYRPVWGDSHDPNTRQTVANIVGSELVDFLFIDGDHSYAGVKADWTDYSGLVRPGGLIAFHDILHCERHTTDKVEVPQFWDELKRLVAKSDEFNVNGGWGGIGVVYV